MISHPQEWTCDRCGKLRLRNRSLPQETAKHSWQGVLDIIRRRSRSHVRGGDCVDEFSPEEVSPSTTSAPSRIVLLRAEGFIERLASGADSLENAREAPRDRISHLPWRDQEGPAAK